jgi:uncharacterized protein
MKKTIFTLLWLCTAHFAHAAPPSSESLEALLKISKAQATVESMYANIEQMMKQTMQQAMQQATKGRPISPEEQRVTDSMPAKFAVLIREEMSWAKLKPMYMQLYSESFEQADIDGLITFYSSPAGQTFINKMPIVMQKSMELTQSQMQTMLPKMMALFEQAAADAKAAK